MFGKVFFLSFWGLERGRPPRGATRFSQGLFCFGASPGVNQFSQGLFCFGVSFGGGEEGRERERGRERGGRKEGKKKENYEGN
jgi:hypothetical protein